MTNRIFHVRALLLRAFVVCTAALLPSQAALLTNPGFESGLAGWSRTDQLGSEGTFFVQTGTASTLTGTTVPAPPEGSQAAMTDAQGPGSHVLFQDFVVPMSVPRAVAMFSLFINNGAPDFFTPDHLAFDSTAPDPDERINQQARVDIMSVTADPFSVSAADVLMNLFQTRPGDPLVSGYTDFAVDITALLQANLGQTLRLRFAEVDNVLNFNFGVDAADISVSEIPEPSTWIMTGAGVFGLIMTRRRAHGK